MLRGWSGPLGRRILVSFLLAATVPMLLMLAVMLPALGALDRSQDEKEQARLLRQVALQVSDRIGVARQTLAAWPATGVAPRNSAEAGLGDVFRRVGWLDADGALHWVGGVRAADSEEAPLRAAWQGRPVGQGAMLLSPRPASGRQEATVWLLQQTATGQAWFAELRAEYLWRPVADADADSLWCVRDHSGQPLSCDVAGFARSPDEGAEVQGRHELILAGEFATPAWLFEARHPRRGMLLSGLPIRAWLLGLSLAALLVASWLSLTQIRRTLVPLRHLQDVARRMARREPGARAEIESGDEVGNLGEAFNEMADRLDAQFKALEVLASIDRDILAAEPVERVTERVLAEMLAHLPISSAGLVRRESAHGHTVLQTVLHRGASTARCRAIVLADGDWTRFAGWSQDRRAAWSTVRRLGWADGLAPEDVSQVVFLPVQEGGEVEGIVALGLAEGVRLGSELRRVARDLRDRIGVALASHRRAAELAFRATHDALTGLLNRNGAHERLDAWLAVGQPAVLCIDLDRFKQVNDSLGHEVGDELLRQAAERLLGCTPPGGIVARMGGDEFVVVLSDVAPAAADVTTALASEICTRLALPFRLRGQEMVLGASVGIALAAAHGRSRADLMRHADIAMYEAKRAGRGRYAMFEMPLDARVLERTRLLSELREALPRHELLLHFQPRVRSVDGRIESAEALVRWQHPRRGLLAPGAFIELAEESDLIEALGNEVLELACAQLARWRVEGLQLARLSVNVSPRQLQSGRLLSVVREALQRHRLPASAIELEVTESLLVGDAREAHAQLAELRSWGAQIALDDFGTGYSSMATLHQLPIDVLKVDRAFVRNLELDSTSMAITRAIVALGQSLGLHTVAEGMETEKQAALVRGLGIDEMQGYYFSKPLDAQAFAALLQQGRRDVPPAMTLPAASRARAGRVRRAQGRTSAPGSTPISAPTAPASLA